MGQPDTLVSFRKGKRTGRSETSQYPEEKKSTEILQVVANERGRAQNLCM